MLNLCPIIAREARGRLALILDHQKMVEGRHDHTIFLLQPESLPIAPFRCLQQRDYSDEFGIHYI